MSTGMLGYIGVGVDSAGAGGPTGAYSSTIVDYLPFISETMAAERNDLPDQSITANFYRRRYYNGLQRVQGGLQTYVHPLLTGYLLRSVFDACTATVGAGTMVTSFAGVREHRFVALGQTQFHAGSGSDMPTLTLEVNRGPVMGAGSSFVYYNCAGNTVEITAEAGNIVRCGFEFQGRDFGGKPRSTPTYVPQDAYLWSQVSVSVGGVSKPTYESLTFRINNNLESVPTLDGRLRPNLIKRNDFGEVTVNGAISFQDFVDYDAFLAGSETMLRATFTGKVISTSGHQEQMEITVPKTRYAAFPLNIGGPGRLTATFTMNAPLDQTSLYAAQVSLVNTRISSYVFNTTA